MEDEDEYDQDMSTNTFSAINMDTQWARQFGSDDDDDLFGSDMEEPEPDEPARHFEGSVFGDVQEVDEGIRKRNTELIFDFLGKAEKTNISISYYWKKFFQSLDVTSLDVLTDEQYAYVQAITYDKQFQSDFYKVMKKSWGNALADIPAQKEEEKSETKLTEEEGTLRYQVGKQRHNLLQDDVSAFLMEQFRRGAGVDQIFDAAFLKSTFRAAGFKQFVIEVQPGNTAARMLHVEPQYASEGKDAKGEDIGKYSRELGEILYKDPLKRKRSGARASAYKAQSYGLSVLFSNAFRQWFTKYGPAKEKDRSIYMRFGLDKSSWRTKWPQEYQDKYITLLANALAGQENSVSSFLSHKDTYIPLRDAITSAYRKLTQLTKAYGTAPQNYEARLMRKDPGTIRVQSKQPTKKTVQRPLMTSTVQTPNPNPLPSRFSKIWAYLFGDDELVTRTVPPWKQLLHVDQDLLTYCVYDGIASAMFQSTKKGKPVSNLKRLMKYNPTNLLSDASGLRTILGEMRYNVDEHFGTIVAHNKIPGDRLQEIPFLNDLLKVDDPRKKKIWQRVRDNYVNFIVKKTTLPRVIDEDLVLDTNYRQSILGETGPYGQIKRTRKGVLKHNLPKRKSKGPKKKVTIAPRPKKRPKRSRPKHPFAYWGRAPGKKQTKYSARNRDAKKRIVEALRFSDIYLSPRAGQGETPITIQEMIDSFKNDIYMKPDSPAAIDELRRLKDKLWDLNEIHRSMALIGRDVPENKTGRAKVKYMEYEETTEWKKVLNAINEVVVEADLLNLLDSADTKRVTKAGSRTLQENYKYAQSILSRCEESNSKILTRLARRYVNRYKRELDRTRGSSGYN